MTTQTGAFFSRYKYTTYYTNINNNIPICYIDEGGLQQKSTLLFIHGLGSYIPAWYRNIDILKNFYRCIALDLPGYGRSPQGDYPYSMKFYAHIIIQFIEKLGIKNVTLIGHSMGGQIAIKSVILEEGAVEKLVLVAPAGFETFSSMEANILKNVRLSSLMRSMSVQQIYRNFELNFYKLDAYVQLMIDDRIRMMEHPIFYNKYCEIIENNSKAMLDEPVFKDLHLLDLPTLTVFGEKDKLIPTAIHPMETTFSIAQKGAKNISKSILQMIPNAGHFVMHEEAEIFNQLILKFV